MIFTLWKRQTIDEHGFIPSVAASNFTVILLETSVRNLKGALVYRVKFIFSHTDVDLRPISKVTDDDWQTNTFDFGVCRN